MTYQLDCPTFPSNSGTWRFRLESPQTKHVYNPGGDKTIASWGPAGFFDPTKPTLKLPVWHVAKNATWEVVGIDQKKEGVGEKHPGNKFVGYLFQEYQQFHLWRTNYHDWGFEGQHFCDTFQSTSNKCMAKYPCWILSNMFVVNPNAEASDRKVPMVRDLQVNIKQNPNRNAILQQHPKTQIHH